ncbi:hypothetical protein [Microbispora sp. CA-102843]|uniref:hypothetical protein n=1 Tax=Microbispora sp. CA-102843 TaxID=3239952 RepID=UPI003D9184DB
MAARAAEHRHRQLVRTADPPLRARLADQVLYLSGSPRARRDLYADERGEFSVRRAGDGDDETIGRKEPGRTAELVRTALRELRTPPRTAASGPRPAPALADLLRQAVEALASSASAVDAEAGEILRLHYLTRAGGHDLLAHRLHLSRATYFRRLEYGIGKVAEAVSRALTPPEHR